MVGKAIASPHNALKKLPIKCPPGCASAWRASQRDETNLLSLVGSARTPKRGDQTVSERRGC